MSVLWDTKVSIDTSRSVLVRAPKECDSRPQATFHFTCIQVHASATCSSRASIGGYKVMGSTPTQHCLSHEMHNCILGAATCRTAKRYAEQV